MPIQAARFQITRWMQQEAMVRIAAREMATKRKVIIINNEVFKKIL